MSVSTAERFEDWLRELEREDLSSSKGAEDDEFGLRLPQVKQEKKSITKRRKSLKAAQMSSILALSEPRPEWDRRRILEKTKKKKDFPLAPVSSEAQEERSQRLFRQVLKEANLDTSEPGYPLWACLPTGILVPPTLTVLGQRLLWLDTGPDKERIAKCWFWNGKHWHTLRTEDISHFKKRLIANLGSKNDQDDDFTKKRFRREGERAPLGLLKLGCEALKTSFAQALSEQDELLISSIHSKSGHALKPIFDGSSLARCVDTALRTNPSEATNISIQAYIVPRAQPCMIRVVAEERHSPYAWIFTDARNEWVTNSAINRPQRCSIIKSPRKTPKAWAEPKHLTSQLLAVLKQRLTTFGARLVQIGADFVQDRDSGHWWLIQIKAYRLASNQSLSPHVRIALLPAAIVPANSMTSLLSESNEIKRRRRCSFTKAPQKSRRGALRPREDARYCYGAFCSQSIPSQHQHMYGDSIGQGALYSLNRKTIDDRDPEAPEYVSLSKKERIALYETVRVCANCHFEYVGKSRIIDIHGPSQNDSSQRQAPIVLIRTDEIENDDCSSSSSQVEALALPQAPAETPLSPQHNHSIQEKEIRLEDPSPPQNSPKDRVESAAAVLRATMDDIDAIHDRASLEMASAMNSHLTASLFLSTVDKTIEEAALEGAKRYAAEITDPLLSASPLVDDKNKSTTVPERRHSFDKM